MQKKEILTLLSVVSILTMNVLADDVEDMKRYKRGLNKLYKPAKKISKRTKECLKMSSSDEYNSCMREVDGYAVKKANRLLKKIYGKNAIKLSKSKDDSFWKDRDKMKKHTEELDDLTNRLEKDMGCLDSSKTIDEYDVCAKDIWKKE